MNKLIKRLIANMVGYVVYVHSQDVKPYKHVTLSYQEALEWAACYPASFGSAVIMKRRLVRPSLFVGYRRCEMGA